MTEIKKQLAAYAARIEGYLAQQLDEMERGSGSMELSQLYAAMRHSLSAGGKRIRPALIYAFCEACGGDLDKADAAASAMEMTHTASLIFDDLPALDNDDLRRGKPSCHKAFGEATAILAGYAMICAPFAAVSAEDRLTDAQKVAILRVLSEMEGAWGMVGGQMMDMQFETQEDVTLEELETMCLGKTGALMRASCEIGCICGGGDPEQIRAAGQFGLSVGLAFQIVDDILDVTSTTEQLGKPVGSDADEHKTTFVTLLGIEQAKCRAAELTEQAHRQLEHFAHAEFLHALTDMLLVRAQ